MPWAPDVATAQAQAKAEGKSVLIHFSGSDWCGWCIKLRKEVFLKPDFEAYARSNLVLVAVDFPKHKTVPAGLQYANQRLVEQFQVQGIPTLVLLDSQGKRLGNVNYAQGGPKAFLAEVEKLLHPPLDTAPIKPTQPRATPPPRREGKGDGIAAARLGLTLQKITVSKDSRQAVINDRTLSPGETATVQATSGQVRVRCLEVRAKSVIVTVNGRKDRHELRLARTI
jgi:thiol-disulfide isomerase/thioredoxin